MGISYRVYSKDLLINEIAEEGQAIRFYEGDGVKFALVVYEIAYATLIGFYAMSNGLQCISSTGYKSNFAYNDENGGRHNIDDVFEFSSNFVFEKINSIESCQVSLF
jgi:hypothetical protein